MILSEKFILEEKYTLTEAAEDIIKSIDKIISDYTKQIQDAKAKVNPVDEKYITTLNNSTNKLLATDVDKARLTSYIDNFREAVIAICDILSPGWSTKQGKLAVGEKLNQN